MLSNIYNIPLI